MGVKSFFKKIGKGLKKAGRFIKDKVFPVIGRIAKPVLSVIGALPGHIGMVGKIGGSIANIFHSATSQIPNEDARKKIDEAIARGHEKFQTVVDKGKDLADGANRTIGVGRDIVNDIRQRIKTLPVDTASKVNWKK